MTKGIEAIAKEREDQIIKYGFTGLAQAIRPAYYDRGQLLYAARMLSVVTINSALVGPPALWNHDWWVKLCDKPYMERLAIAGALIAAEIDRQEAIKQNNILQHGV
ncbi:hypothetical protein [Elizabethkingia phage TCUEAP1]|nr:hypothetical protein [Elizabethkingia phage TCUEAP1]